MRLLIIILFFLFSNFIFAQREYSDLIKTVSQNINVNLDSCDFELISEKILPSSEDKSIVIIPELIGDRYCGYKENFIHIIVVNNKNSQILQTYTDTLFSQEDSWLNDITIHTKPYNLINGFGIIYKEVNCQSNTAYIDINTISIFITSKDTLQKVLNKLEVYSYVGTSYTFDDFSEVSASSYSKKIIVDSNKTNGLNNLIIKESGEEYEASEDVEFTETEISNKIDTLKFNGEIYTTLPFTVTSQIKEIYPDSIRPLILSAKEEKKINKKLDNCVFKLKNDISFTEKEAAFFEIWETSDGYWKVNKGPSVHGDRLYTHKLETKIEASSFLNPQGVFSYNPENVYDFDYKNVWAEGVPGYGIGEYITFSKEGGDFYSQVIIANGYVKSKSAWKNNSRVKKIKLYIDNKPIYILNLEDSRSEQCFKLSFFKEPHEEMNNLKFEILDIYKGEKYDDTVISEIYFDYAW